MISKFRTCLAALGASLVAAALTSRAAEPIPLPEHPRPDFERSAWLNLNGPWQFRFDKDNAGLNEKWFEAANTIAAAG